jgi:hypothetical protein
MPENRCLLRCMSPLLAHTGDDGRQPATAAFWGSAVADGHRPSICDNVLYHAWNCWHCDSQPVFAIRGDVGDQSVFEGDFLDFAGHVPQIYQ